MDKIKQKISLNYGRVTQDPNKEGYKFSQGVKWKAAHNGINQCEKFMGKVFGASDVIGLHTSAAVNFMDCTGDNVFTITELDTNNPLIKGNIRVLKTINELNWVLPKYFAFKKMIIDSEEDIIKYEKAKKELGRFA